MEFGRTQNLTISWPAKLAKPAESLHVTSPRELHAASTSTKGEAALPEPLPTCPFPTPEGFAPWPIWARI